MAKDTIQIQLTAQTIDSYCADLRRLTSRIEKRVIALDALKTFLTAVTDPGEQATPAFSVIRETLLRHFDTARAELMQEQSDVITNALRQRKLWRIVPVYNALSRDAFWTILISAKDMMGSEERGKIARWSYGWLQEVKDRSAQTSPYPDTIDFKGAGIEVAEYTAMSDISACFS